MTQTSKESASTKSGRTEVAVDTLRDTPSLDVPADAAARHAELTRIITDAQFRYYVLDAPTMTDGEFDTLLRELEALEAAVPVAASRPTRRPSGSAAASPPSSLPSSTPSAC